MKKLYKAPAILFLFSATLFPVSVWGADFTFQVPLRLNKLHPQVQSATVMCNVASSSNPEAQIGSGKGSAPRGADGTINQTVTVAFDANPGKDPSEANIYTCFLRINGPKGEEGNPSTNAAAPIWRKIKPGSTSKTLVSGSNL